MKLLKYEFPQLLPIFQIIINKSPSPTRNNIAPIPAFTGYHPSSPIDTFIRTTDSSVVTVTDLQREHTLHVHNFISHMDQLHPVIQPQLQQHWSQSRSVRSCGKLADFTEKLFPCLPRSIFLKTKNNISIGVVQDGS